MIDKQDFYHGVAIIRLIEDALCQKIQKHDFGYTVNDEVLIFLKYSTKSRSPWRFSFNDHEIEQLDTGAISYKKTVIVLICGGDGICAISWDNIKPLLGRNAGWISVRRKFNEQYTVAGPNGVVKGKVPMRQWPSIIFGG